MMRQILGHKKNKSGLSIIEVMVAIMIFATGISGIFMMVNSTVNANAYNKNYIIASNLAREQIELIRNIRDTNYKKIQAWNIQDPLNASGGKFVVTDLSTTGHYKLQNDDTGSFPIKVEQGGIVSIPGGDFKQALKGSTYNLETEKYQLCIDTAYKYVYCEGTSGLKPTRFYRYIEIVKLDKDKISGMSQFPVGDAFKVRSIVLWREKGIYSTEQNTVLTDWKRL